MSLFLACSLTIFKNAFDMTGGATININNYSVNVRFKFHSIEGATIYDANFQ